jgi:hypothetical protein
LDTTSFLLTYVHLYTGASVIVIPQQALYDNVHETTGESVIVIPSVCDREDRGRVESGSVYDEYLRERGAGGRGVCGDRNTISTSYILKYISLTDVT